MGRTNYVLLALGLGSILILSVMMQHLLKVHKDHKQGPIVREVVATFGARLASEPSLSLEAGKSGKEAILTIQPLTGVDRARLSQETGEYVWRRLGAQEALASVQIRCIDELDGVVVTYPIARPLFVPLAESRPAPEAVPRPR